MLAKAMDIYQQMSWLQKLYKRALSTGYSTADVARLKERIRLLKRKHTLFMQAAEARKNRLYNKAPL